MLRVLCLLVIHMRSHTPMSIKIRPALFSVQFCFCVGVTTLQYQGGGVLFLPRGAMASLAELYVQADCACAFCFRSLPACACAC